MKVDELLSSMCSCLMEIIGYSCAFSDYRQNRGAGQPYKEIRL
jgi:hypothetical protein